VSRGHGADTGGRLASALRNEVRDCGTPLRVLQGRVRLEIRRVQDQTHADSVLYECRVGEGIEGDHCPDDRVGQGQISRHRGQVGAEGSEALIEPAPGDVVLRRKVAEEGPPADSGAGGDLVRGGLDEALGREETERDLFDGSVAGRRRTPRRGDFLQDGGFHPLIMAHGVTNVRGTTKGSRMEEPSNAIDDAVEGTQEATLIEDISIDGMCGVY